METIVLFSAILAGMWAAFSFLAVFSSTADQRAEKSETVTAALMTGAVALAWFLAYIITHWPGGEI